jgi:hypothetical protein
MSCTCVSDFACCRWPFLDIHSQFTALQCFVLQCFERQLHVEIAHYNRTYRQTLADTLRWSAVHIFLY